MAGGRPEVLRMRTDVVGKVLKNSMSTPPLSGPPVSSPSVPKKKKPLARSVYLEEEDWKDLDACAHFHEVMFKLQGEEQTVSRNDVIVAFLTWARDAFWKDKGGKPKGEREVLEKAKQHAERLARKKDTAAE